MKFDNKDKSVIYTPTPQLKMAEEKILKAYEIVDANQKVVFRTSANDGKHMQNSKHFENNAVDLRTRHLGDYAQLVLTRLLTFLLGHDYDVVLEEDHLHVEYDPKGNSE